MSLVRMERDRGRLGDTEKEPDRGVVSRRQGDLNTGLRKEDTSSVFYAFLSSSVRWSWEVSSFPTDFFLLEIKKKKKNLLQSPV